MKIGIFGDSFAQEAGTGSWVTMLSEKHEVNCNAFCGTSLFHCYQTMLQTDMSLFDIVIVAVTNAGRLYTGYDIDIEKPYLSGIETAMYHKKTASAADIDRINAGISYYLHLMEDSYINYVQESIVRDIIDLVPCKLILLPSFLHSYTPTLNRYVSEYINSNFSLYCITEMERQILNVNPGSIEKDTLYNHMCEDNNRILCSYITDLLSGRQKKLSLDLFVSPSMNREYYYE